MSNKPSAETLPGTRTTDPAREAAAINIARRRMREKANSVRNANSTQHNTYAPTRDGRQRDSP
jgi:hypothetical protein